VERVVPMLRTRSVEVGPPSGDQCALVMYVRAAVSGVGEVDQLAEGDVVAFSRPFDQPRPHRRGSPSAPESGASPRQMVALAEQFTVSTPLRSGT
jgi:hypothetical protein